MSLKDTHRLDALYIDDTAEKITSAGITHSSAIAHPAGTVILSRDAGVGKSAIMKESMAVSQHFMAWHCGPQLNNHFLYYWLQAEKHEFERITIGSTIKTIGLPYFRNLRVPLPACDEQRAIAAALSDADTLIAALDKLIAKKRAVKTATMQQLLTGKQRLPGFSGEWEVKRLGDLAEINSGGTPASNIPGYYGGSIPWVSITDMTKHGKYITATDRHLTEKGLDTSAARMFPKGTVLYAMYASIGECSIAGVDLSSSRGLVINLHAALRRAFSPRLASERRSSWRWSRASW